MAQSAGHGTQMPLDAGSQSSVSAQQRSKLPDLDLDELSPLPPAQSFTLRKSASDQKDEEAHMVTAAPDTVASSPALSAAPSSFRLEGSPPSSLNPADSPVLTPSRNQRINTNHISPDRQQQPGQTTTHRQDHNDQPRQSQEWIRESTAAAAASARYVTVSAILSRSEMYYAPETSEHWDILRSPLDGPTDARESHDPYSQPSSSLKKSSSLRRRTSQRKRPSNGSAIEALGALLLRKDSSGRVANLSCTRDDHPDETNTEQASAATSTAKRKPWTSSKHGVQAWTSALGTLGKNGIRLQLPGATQAKPSSSKSGATIAERRAHMWHQLLTRQGAVVEGSHDGFSTVRSRRGGLSFEVGASTRKPTISRKSTPSTLLDLENYKPNGRGKGKEYEMQGQDVNSAQLDDNAFASLDSGRLPDTIVLKAGRRPRLNQGSKSEFGIGSAYHDQTLPEAPPSPVAMPGAWHGGSSWRTKPGDGYEEGALLLPPPLLDDNGSDAASFEGLLGVRRMREREKARKQAERLAARNRPAHKVGPLTALTNFVKAAHAAETSAKRANAARRFGQPPSFFRSYTEPQRLPRPRADSLGSLANGSEAVVAAAESLESSMDPSRDGDMLQADDSETTLQSERTDSVSISQGAAEAELRKSPGMASVSPFLSAAARRAVLSRRGSRTNSVDPAGRQLNTVFEFEPLHPSQIPDDQLASPDLPPISSPLLRPTSRGSTRTSALRDFPAAPRLLPVQLSMPPSPFTPLATDYRSDIRESRGPMGPPPSGMGDYLSARALHSAPRTPQLGPTMLSLPPSPWTPYQDSSLAPGSPMIHLHLNTSSSSLRLPPGTPRLIPTHLEILPSPFPTSASSRRGSLTYDSPQSLRASGLAKSPLAGAIKDATAFTALRGSRPTSQASITAVEAKAGRTSTEIAAEETTSEHPPKKSSKSNGTIRLTPSSMLVAAQSARTRDMNLQDSTSLFSADKHAVSGADQNGKPTKRRRSSQGTIHVDSSGRKRSFILWFLVGDLGLRNRETAGSDDGNSSKELDADYGGLAAIFVHIFGLLVFVMAHLVDLAYLTYERVSMVLWFLRWMLYNLTGRTVLAQCVIEAYGFIQAEWATVALEDHEEKGSKEEKAHARAKKPKGLTRWQVVRGLLELYCLHAVTRERYLAEGAGLQKLEGWSQKKSQQEVDRKAQEQPGSDRLDIGVQRAASRAAVGNQRRSWSQPNGNDDHIEDYESDDYQYTNDNSAANAGSQWSAKLERTNGQLNDDSQDEDDDSSDDEMIVTNRGDDILEFAKTPRLDAARPGEPSGGYFGRVYDFMTSPQVGASNPRSMNRDMTPFRESNRDLVRTIKWCGRLAISAYGLHVHIVDLPPTFTPSGERFSRQTFAYLSRLNADDVLHADIQTLDADADYSPTFYIVRDYVRKVVCVAVRGTQSFSDIIVDLEMQTEEIELPQVQPTPGEEFRCHAGIWRAAKALVSPQSKLFTTLRQALAENEGFSVMFCGHSLGGAIASAAALLLAEYFIPDGADQESGTWVTNMSSGLPARRPIRAVSFASPVTMTADLASRAALGSVPLVTTVVLGSDIIPRAGHGQVRELRRALGALSRVRRRHAMSSSEGQDDARVHILRSYWDWRSISMAEDPDDVMLHRKERIEEQLWSLRREVESDLYAAIKARLDAESLAGARIPPSPWVGPEQREQAPLHALAVRRQELDATTLRSEAAQGGPLIPPGRCIWINDKQIYHVQSPLAFFSLPELRSDMFAAHFPAAYEEAILELRT